MDFILAQILGIIALIFVSIGYFLKNKESFLKFQIVSNFFYAAAFFVIGSYVGAFIVMISNFSCLYLYFSEKKSFKYKLHFLPIFVIAYAIITIVFWKNTFDFIPLITSIMFTFGLTIKNLQSMRYFLIIPNALLVVYNILTSTYASALLDFIEIVVIICAIVKFYKNGNKAIINE